MTADAELAVLGAGPAGLAAALAAADAGLTVALLDAAPQPGGQYYRQTAPVLRARRPQALHHSWTTWRRLTARLAEHRRAGRIRLMTDHQIWCAEPGYTLHSLTGTVSAQALVLATGGYERVLPFPGWTLPGVLTAGGVQAVLKGSLTLPGRRIVVAGTGPLLLPVAAALADAGATVAALAESSAATGFLPHAGTLAAHPGKLAEAAGYAARLARHRVPLLPGHTVLEAHGTDRITAVTLADRQGRSRRIACDALAVSHGLLPRAELAQTLGARLDEQGAVAVDAEQRSSLPGLWAAGENTGVGGAQLALAEGEIAGLSAAARLHGHAPTWAAVARAVRTRRRLRGFADALRDAYRPPAGWAERLPDSTLLCRCEEVPAGAVREAVRDLGATDLRTVKLLTRAGMGWCQGRVCTPGVAAVAGCPALASPGPFAHPVPLGVLARDPGPEAGPEQRNEDPDDRP